MLELITKQNELFGKVRFIKINEITYAAASDVAKALGYSNPQKAVRDHCKNTRQEQLQSGERIVQATFIPESDIYRLIIKSKLPQAEEFEHWVMEEVLPQIRQTGGYIPVQVEETEEEFLARAYLVAQKTLAKKEQLLKQQEQQLIEQKPKVDYYDEVLQPANLKTTTEIAKDFGMNAKKLNDFLHENKIIFPKKVKKDNIWQPYAKYEFLIAEGYADYHINQYGQRMKWSEKGREWIYQLLIKKGVLMPKGF